MELTVNLFTVSDYQFQNTIYDTKGLFNLTNGLNSLLFPMRPIYQICACIVRIERLRWSRGSVLAFRTQVRGFKPGRSLRIFYGEKILSAPSFGGKVKPSVPCRRFAACKRSLNLSGSRNLGKITGQFLAHSSTFRSRVVADVETPGGESGNSKGGGKQWQTTPKNLLRMQCARAIPVT